MGTRHLVVAVVNEEVKVAQYGQFDGYFTGVGEDIASFIRNSLQDPEVLNKFKMNLIHSTFVSSEYITSLQKECGVDITQEYVSFGDHAWNKFIELYPQFYRNTSSDVFELVLNKPQALRDSFTFGFDSLFCEYAYVLNLDNSTLEIYTGFNKEEVPDSETRWNSTAKSTYQYKEFDGDDGGVRYYYVKLYKVVTFQELFDNTDFMSTLEKEYDDYEE